MASWAMCGSRVYGPYIMSRLNAKSGCKKWFRISGKTKEDARRAGVQMMTWCSHAQEYSRQRSHMTWLPAYSDCPTAAFLLARRLPPESAPARGACRHDEDLDRMGVPLHLLPPDSWARCKELEEAAAGAATSADPAPVPRGGRGRGRGRGRGGAVEPVAAPAPATKSSSSSSSPPSPRLESPEGTGSQASKRSDGSSSGSSSD